MFAATGDAMSSYVLQVQRAVSEALLAVHEGTDDATLRVSLRKFPELKGTGVSSSGGRGRRGPPAVGCKLHSAPRTLLRALVSKSDCCFQLQATHYSSSVRDLRERAFPARSSTSLN